MEQTKSVLTKRSILKHFPKIELHRHLEGTFPVDKLYKLSKKNKLDRPEDYSSFKRTVQFPKNSGPDFLTFLAKFKTDWYRSHEDVSYITYHSIKKLKKENIFYIEIRFSPEHFSLQNDFNREEITRVVIEAGNRAAAEENIHIKYLLTFNRNKQTSGEMIKLYERLKKLDIPEIVGVDLAGDELNYPPELFKSFFRRVTKDGIYKSTIHEGEVTSSDQIWTAVRDLHASRIGHGTAAIGDPALQEYLKENGIALEQCITSNYQTGSWEDEKNHPIGALYRSGVPVTINSDDPFIQDTELTDDYIKAIKYFDFTLDDLIRLNMTALDTSFISDDEKELYREEYYAELDKFKRNYL